MTLTPVSMSSGWPVNLSKEEPESPKWWTDRLYRQLQLRLPVLSRYNDYYRGRHPLPWLAPQVSEAFQRIIQMSRSNYMGLVCDATTERLEVLGFRLGEDSPAGDEEAWRIWQANNLDAFAGDVFLEAVKTGSAFMLVAPNPKDPKTPKITIEHPSQVIVEYAIGDLTERDAGLKVWHNDRLNEIHANLYLPDAIYKWRGRMSSVPSTWEERMDPGDPSWPLANPYGVVPIIELRNNPQWIYDEDGLRYRGVSELADVTDAQDRINKTIADRLMTQDFGAFPQKWANNWGEDEDEDDAFDSPAPAVVDPDGEAVAAKLPGAEIDIGRDRLLVATGNTTFGQFAAAPLDPYSNAKSEDVKDIASRTRTPSQYLLGEIVNVSGEALQAAESGLVAKVKQRQRPFAEGIEEVMRLAFKVAGDDRADDTAMQLIWRDPEHRSIGALIDAITKKIQVKLITRRQGQEDAGYTPQEIARMEKEFRKEALEAAMAAALAAPPPPAPGQEPPAPGEPGQQTPPPRPPAPPPEQ